MPDRENSGHEQWFRARPGFRLGLAGFGHDSDLVRHLVRLLVSVDQVGLLRFILEGLPLVKAWEKKIRIQRKRLKKLKVKTKRYFKFWLKKPETRL